MADVAGGTRTRHGGPGHDELLRRWQRRCQEQGDSGPTWPSDAARSLLRAVLSPFDPDVGRDNGHADDLDSAARDWAVAHASMPRLLRRLGNLRETVSGPDVVAGTRETIDLQRRLDRVTLVATEAALAELEDAALTDALTGVGNRRAMEGAARTVLAEARRSSRPVSLVCIDLDGLKQINDTEGHLAGDRALVGLARSIGNVMRESDQLFRFGGDEFVALLPLTPAPAVSELMGRATTTETPSFSWGAATLPDDGATLEDLLHLADRRLYAGRHLARPAAADPATGLAATTAGLRRPGRA